MGGDPLTFVGGWRRPPKTVTFSMSLSDVYLQLLFWWILQNVTNRIELWEVGENPLKFWEVGEYPLKILGGGRIPPKNSGRWELGTP